MNMTSLGLVDDKENGDDILTRVLNAGDARIVTNNEFHIRKDINDLINAFLDEPHKRFIKKSENKDEIVVSIQANDPTFLAMMLKARTIAINNYADSVSMIAVNKINDNLNKIVLVGPFAHGVNAHIKNNSSIYKAKDLPDLIKQKVDKRIQDVDLPSTEGLKQLYKFDVICDEDINFSNNTVAGRIFLHPDFNFIPNRGGWMDIPKTTLAKLN